MASPFVCYFLSVCALVVHIWCYQKRALVFRPKRFPLLPLLLLLLLNHDRLLLLLRQCFLKCRLLRRLEYPLLLLL